MIFVPPALLGRIVEAAEAAYPGECCGLLVGRRRGAGDIEVSRLEPSPNLTADRGRDRFEVDPQLRFDLMGELADGPQRIVGHYHSHPDHPAQPSPSDLEMALEPELVWVITSVIDGQAVHTTAHVVDQDGSQFREIGLRTTDWRPYPTRPEDAP